MAGRSAAAADRTREITREILGPSPDEIPGAASL